jgi:hypothetical protein
MVSPLVILTIEKPSKSSGMFECEYPEPEWWTAAPVASAVVEEPPVTIVTPKKPVGLFDDQVEKEAKAVVTPAKKPVTQPVTQPVPTGSAWIDSLFASAGYKNQRESIRRHAPEDEIVRRCLEALDASGGLMTPSAFAKAADIPAARLDGLISRIQRLLNVDGYEILTFSRAENRVELNVSKLKRQFDLE